MQTLKEQNYFLGTRYKDYTINNISNVCVYICYLLQSFFRLIVLNVKKKQKTEHITMSILNITLFRKYI